MVSENWQYIFSFSRSIFKARFSQRLSNRELFCLGLTFPKRQILDSSKLIKFTDDNFKFDGNERKLFKRVENGLANKIFCYF